jgi:D-alanyl-D-alanine carboxypeptidase (penicillin-binding protein 5/6)
MLKRFKMKKILKKMFVFVGMSALLVAVLPFSRQAAAFTPANITLRATAALVVNRDTGQIMYSQNADKRRYPASITKLMVALLAVEKTLDLDSTQVTVSQSVMNDLAGTDSSLAGFQVGETATMRQMLYALLIPSGNEIAMAIADNIGGGSVQNFVDMMNVRAKELGMNSTHFCNPHGLNADDDPKNAEDADDSRHYTTAQDLYILTDEIIRRHTLIMDICSLTRYTMPATNKSPERILLNTNFLLDPTSSFYYKNATVRGLKTGHTERAGRCLISTAGKNGLNYSVIVLGCRPKTTSGAEARYELEDTAALYDWVFNKFEYKRVLTKEQPIKGGQATVNMAWDVDFVPLVPAEDYYLLLPKEADETGVILQPEVPDTSRDAPIKKGEVMGKVRLLYAQEEIGSADLVAAEDIDRSALLYVGQELSRLAKTAWFRALVTLFVILLIAAIVLNVIHNKRRRRTRNYRRGR